MKKFYLECRLIKCPHQYSQNQSSPYYSPKESSSKMSQYHQQNQQHQQGSLSPTEQYCEDKDEHFFEQLNKWIEKERLNEEEELQDQIIDNQKQNLKNKKTSGLVVNNICYNCGSFTCHCPTAATATNRGQGPRSTIKTIKPGSISTRSNIKSPKNRSQKVLLPRVQSSRSLLFQSKIVQSKKEKWEQFAKDQKEIDDRYFSKRRGTAGSELLRQNQNQDQEGAQILHWTNSVDKNTQTEDGLKKGQLNGLQKGQVNRYQNNYHQEQKPKHKSLFISRSESSSESYKYSNSTVQKSAVAVENQNKSERSESIQQNKTIERFSKIPPVGIPTSAISSTSRVVKNHGFKQIGQLLTIKHHRKSIEKPSESTVAESERDLNATRLQSSTSKSIAMTMDRNAPHMAAAETSPGNHDEDGLDEILQHLKNEYDNLKLIKNQPKIWDVRKSKEQISSISPPSLLSSDAAAAVNKKKSRGSLVVIDEGLGPNSQRSQNTSSSNKVDDYSFSSAGPLEDKGFKWTITSLTRKVSDMKLKMDHQREQLKCHFCQEPFAKGEFAIQNPESDKFWHVGHLSCKICDKEFTNECFFHDGEVFCEEHYFLMSQIPKCQNPKCLKFIYDERYILASNKTYHTRCFTCSICRNQIIDAKYVSFRGQVYCFPCHQKEFNHVCSTCHENIKPSESFVQSSSVDPESNLFWHSSKFCLRCQTCSKNLIGRNQLFVNKDGSLYCNRYCAQRKIPPV